MEKVFVVHITQVSDGSELRNDVRCFSTMEKAKEYAEEFIADEKAELAPQLESDDWEDDNGWEVDDNWEKYLVWEAYEYGYYCQNHTSVAITEETIY